MMQFVLIFPGRVVILHFGKVQLARELVRDPGKMQTRRLLQS